MSRTIRKKIVAWLAPELHAKLLALSVTEDRPMSAIVREAVRAGLNSTGSAAKSSRDSRVSS